MIACSTGRTFGGERHDKGLAVERLSSAVLSRGNSVKHSSAGICGRGDGHVCHVQLQALAVIVLESSNKSRVGECLWGDEYALPTYQEVGKGSDGEVVDALREGPRMGGRSSRHHEGFYEL